MYERISRSKISDDLFSKDKNSILLYTATIACLFIVSLIIFSLNSDPMESDKVNLRHLNNSG